MEKDVLYQLIEDAVNDIAAVDYTDLHRLSNSGLFDGLAGLALFYFEWYQFTQKEIYLDKCLDLLRQSYQHSGNRLNLSHGMTGTMWLLQYLRQSDVLDENYDGLLNKYDDTLKRLLSGQLDDLDPMHGSLSIANYMSWRGSPENLEGLQKVVNALYDAKIEMEQGIAWMNSKDDEVVGTMQHINFGMAHGIPAILCLLARIRGKGVELQKCDEMLSEGKKYLLSVYDPAGPSHFPNRIQRGVVFRKATVSYCYGDLGISPGLAAVALATDDAVLLDMIRLAAVRMAKISLLYPTDNNDISICHGAGGNAYLFMKLYDIFREEILKDAGLAQYKLSMDLRKKEGGIAGFFSLDHSPEKGGFYYRPNPGFIEGAPGMGLSLIAFLAGKPHNEWDKILFLS